MIEFMTQSTESILGITASGKLSRLDYRDVLAPRIESLAARFETLRVLFLMDESFQGWSIAAAWANTIFCLKHRRDFDRIAMVGAPKWEEWCVKAPATLLMNGELRTFRRNQLNHAWEWLRA
ncbi:MAG: STAS/SEC14 domain-containing protein [Mycobacterium sp.]